MTSASATPTSAPTAEKLEISYHLLDPSEWGRLVPIFDEQEWSLPLPTAAMASVAELDGEIIFVAILQAIPHAEPMWIKPELRGKVDWKRGVRLLEEQIGVDGPQPFDGIVIIAENARVESMARKMGFEPVEGKVFRKHFERVPLSVDSKESEND